MPVPLRADFDARSVRAAAKRSKDGPQARRLLALAATYEGTTRSEAAKIGGVTLQIVRDWVVKFDARGPEGLIDRKAPGQPARLNDTHRAALAEIIESGPMPAVHGVVLAADRSLPMDFRRVPAHDREADPEPRAAGDGLSQALRSPASPCASRWGYRGF